MDAQHRRLGQRSYRKTRQKKGAEKALDGALDQAGLSGQEKRAVKDALKAAGELKF
jgi:hypothetical protein